MEEGTLNLDETLVLPLGSLERIWRRTLERILEFE